MELPLKVIVIVAIVAVVLAAIMLLLFQSTGTTMTRAQAERIFNSQCISYGQRSCEWAVAYEDDFQQYLEACRVLYGKERETFSCLYTYCGRCFETTDLKCSGLCHICNGHDYSDVEKATCCSRYASECSGSAVKCDRACG